MKFLRILLVALLLSAAVLTSAADKKSYLFFVGNYTDDNGKSTGSKGIYAYRYDADSGDITSLGLAAETTNPSWIALSPNRRFLYAVNEVGNFKGPNSGGLSAFTIDHKTGKLTFLNEVPTRGADPCYATVDKTGKYVLVANYTGGSVAVFPIREDGSLGEATSFIQHSGHGANPERQEGPHAHSIDLSPDNRFAFIDDLGLDELLVYKFDAAKGTLTPNDPPFIKLDAGSGPRHFALRPDGKFAYVISEMAGTVTTFSADLKTGHFNKGASVSTQPKAPIEDAEIRVQPSGKFLYASNRGEGNSIAVFSIDPENGALTPVEVASAQGKTPRSFEIDPTGRFLFAENQKSNNIVIFRIDEKSGRLTPTGKVIDAISPVCVKFLAAE